MLKILEKILGVISYTIISVIVLLVLFVGWWWVEGKYNYWRNYSYKPIKKKAVSLTKVFDDKRIYYTNAWGYFRRGCFVFYKETNDVSKRYRVFYYMDDDTIKLQLIHGYHFEVFNQDFNTNIKCDSSIKVVELSKYNDTLVNVAYTVWNIRDTVYNEHFTVRQLFPVNNPFAFFSSITKIVDEYKIASISHDEDNLCMVLSDYYELYYMPNLNDESSRKAFLKRIYCEYETIEQIAKGWYLIKLREPLDFG